MRNHPGFRVTVEDLEAGERQAMVVYPGDYMLIPFEPCHRAGVQVYPGSGTHVITIKGYGPTTAGRPDQPPAVSRDVALLTQRYADLRARVLAGGWPLVVEEVEAADLRQKDTRPYPADPPEVS